MLHYPDKSTKLSLCILTKPLKPQVTLAGVMKTVMTMTMIIIIIIIIIIITIIIIIVTIFYSSKIKNAYLISQVD